METKNPIIEKKPSITGFFDTQFQPDLRNSTEIKAEPVESDLNFDLDSVNLSDISLEEHPAPNDNYNHFEDEEDVGCGCVRFWSWLCPKT